MLVKYDLQKLFDYIYFDEEQGKKDLIETAKIIKENCGVECVFLNDEDDFATDGAGKILDIAKEHKIKEWYVVYMCDYDESQDVAIFYKTEEEPKGV